MTSVAFIVFYVLLKLGYSEVAFVFSVFMSLVMVLGQNVMVSRAKGYYSSFVLLFFVGLAGAYPLYDYSCLRDVWYFVRPLWMFAFGLLLTQKNEINFDRTVFCILVIEFFYHVLNYFAFREYLVGGVDGLRNTVGRGGTMIGMLLGYYMTSWRRYCRVLGSWRLFYWLSLFSFLTVMVMKFSRLSTVGFLFYCFVSITCVAKIVVKRTVTSLLILFTCFLLLTYVGKNYQADSVKGDTYVQVFVQKCFGVFSEMFGEVNEGDSLKYKYTRWRSYESTMARYRYEETSDVRKVFGSGFGATVDLYMNQYLGDQVFREIPILHNGYWMLLVKTGVVGAFLYVFGVFSFLYYRSSYSNSDYVLLFACIVLLTLSTFASSGLLNKNEIISMVLGMIVGRGGISLQH